MRLPRVRFTVRRLMVAVAVVGLLFGMADRSRRFSAIADLYGGYRVQASVTTPEEIRQLKEWNAYRKAFYLKYRRAARYPWLPIESDPPEPK